MTNRETDGRAVTQTDIKRRVVFHVPVCLRRNVTDTPLVFTPTSTGMHKFTEKKVLLGPYSLTFKPKSGSETYSLNFLIALLGK